MEATAKIIDINPGQKEAQKALTVKDQASALTISDKATYEKAAELLLSIKDLRKEIDATFKPIREKAHAAWKETIAQQSRVETPLIEAEAIIKPRMSAFLQEEERKRKAEEDRLRILAEKAEEERRLAEAIQAEEDGDTEEAFAILDEVPAYIPPPIVPKTVSTGGGIQLRESWSFRVENLSALVKAVAAGTVPLGAIQANTVFLGQQARSMKGELRYPGVVVWSEKNIAAGRRY